MHFPLKQQGLPAKRTVAILITLILLLFPIFSSGCGAAEWKSSEGSNPGTMLTLTGADNGKSLALQVGGLFTISLEENPTTGFAWAIDSNSDDLVEQQASVYVPEAVQGVGGGGQRVLTFKAQRPGTGQLKLKLWREWEGDNSIAKRFTVTLRVRE